MTGSAGGWPNFCPRSGYDPGDAGASKGGPVCVKPTGASTLVFLAIFTALTQPANADIGRFLKAQDGVYGRALAELRRGRKRSHWIWFVFPQIAGLGMSATSRYFAIHDLDEARRYLAHPVLGTRLVECAEVLLGLEGRSAAEIFGHPDDMKLKSCMTLFEQAMGEDGVFGRVLDKYYRGERDRRTLEILGARS